MAVTVNRIIWLQTKAARKKCRIDNAQAYTCGCQFKTGDFVTGQLYVINVGGTPANIMESHCEVFYTDRVSLPMERPYEGKDGNNFLGHRRLKPGEPATGCFASA
jgi:hypothetical protein